MATVYTYTRKPSLTHSYCSLYNNRDDTMSLYSYCFTSLSNLYINLLVLPSVNRGVAFGAGAICFSKMQSVLLKKAAYGTSERAVIVTEIAELYDFYDFL